MTLLAPPSVRLLVCGSADRGDDGAALSAVATLLPVLPAPLLARLEVRRCGHLGVRDLLDVPAGELAVVVDAATGVPPGHVVVLPLGGLAADGLAGPLPRSAHDQPMERVLRSALAERPGGLPDGAFVGIGGRRFGFGRPLSRTVRLALPAFRDALAAELLRLTAAVDRTG